MALNGNVRLVSFHFSSDYPFFAWLSLGCGESCRWVEVELYNPVSLAHRILKLSEPRSRVRSDSGLPDVATLGGSQKSVLKASTKAAWSRVSIICKDL